MKTIDEKDEIDGSISDSDKELNKEPLIKSKKEGNNEPLLKPKKEKESTDKKEDIKDNEKEEEILKKKEKTKMTLKDGILTLIGNEFHRIGFGCLMVIHNLTTYLMSYLRHYQEEKTLTLQYTYFIGPVMSITMGLFTPFVGAIENKIGLKLAIILGGILCLWSSVILYLSKNYYFDLFAFFINSCGSSMTALLNRNAMGYFFHIRGKLNGVLSVIGSLVSSAYNAIGEKWIVNPNSEEAVVDKSYYSYEVSKNLLLFLEICWACIIIGTILTVVFVVPYDKKKHVKLFMPKGPKGFDKDKKKKIGIKKVIKKEDAQEDDKIGPLIPDDDKNEEDKKDDEIININDEVKKGEKGKSKKGKNKNKGKNDFSKTSSVPIIVNPNEDKILEPPQNIENKDKTDIKIQKRVQLQKKRSLSISYKHIPASKLPFINIIPEINAIAVAPQEKSVRKKFSVQLIKQALKSRRVLFLFLMGLFSAPLGNILMSTWRNIGIRKGIPTRYLQDIGTYRPFISCGSTLIFSSLSDHIPFRYLYFAFSLLATIVGISFCFTFHSPGWFTFIILLNNVVFAGKLSITGPHYMKVFGLKYYIEIGGVIGLSRVFMSPLCTVFIFLFDTYIAAPEGEENQVSDTPYIILFLVTGLLNLISAVLSLFESEEEFQP